MMIAIIALLAVIAAEAAAALWLASGEHGPGRARPGPEREQSTGEDPEKRWQEGVSSVMGYDLAAARRAVRDSDDAGR